MTEEQNTHGEGLAGEHHHSDSFVVPFIGMQMSLPGGIYTFVFIVLGILTALEVMAAESMESGAMTIVILLGAAIIKALLVMGYYMHLNRDTILYRVVLAFPFVIALVSVLFLVALPQAGGLGYR